MSTLASVVLKGLASALPSASIPGRIYYTTDTLQILRDNGASWDNVTPSAGFPSGTANEVLATPNGSSGTASLRALVGADLPLATTGAFGAVKPDGSTVTISSGVISATAAAPSGTANEVYATPNGSSGSASLRALVPGDLPVATTGALGAVKPDGTSITISSGTISAPVSGITALTGDVTASGTGSVAASVGKVNGGALPASQTVVGTNGSSQVVALSTSANQVIAGPTSGGAAAPTARALVAADLPVATTGALGAVKPDGTTITVSSGTISAVAPTVLPTYENEFIGTAPTTSASTGAMKGWMFTPSVNMTLVKLQTFLGSVTSGDQYQFLVYQVSNAATPTISSILYTGAVHTSGATTTTATLIQDNSMSIALTAGNVYAIVLQCLNNGGSFILRIAQTVSSLVVPGSVSTYTAASYNCNLILNTTVSPSVGASLAIVANSSTAYLIKMAVQF